jgi:predicted DNA-binding transcriptional regulator AlpA
MGKTERRHPLTLSLPAADDETEGFGDTSISFEEAVRMCEAAVRRGEDPESSWFDLEARGWPPVMAVMKLSYVPLWRRVRAGTFPAPVIEGRTPVWKASQLGRYLASRTPPAYAGADRVA